MATKVEDVHIIWVVEGLGCEGDTISVTAATQPSIEDVVLGAIPGLPKVHIHNKCIAYEWGKDFMEWWYSCHARITSWKPCSISSTR
jgi:hydrogenase small subunit